MFLLFCVRLVCCRDDLFLYAKPEVNIICFHDKKPMGFFSRLEDNL